MFLLDQIDRLISTYQWTVGIFITIILGAVAFFSYVQWKIKKEQEQEIKKDITNSLSKDISEVIEPLITTSLNQISIIGMPNYVENIKTFESYLKLDGKYKFNDNVSKQIREWKYFIVSNFKIRIKELFQLNSRSEQLEELKEYNSLFKSGNIKYILMPDPTKLREVSESFVDKVEIRYELLNKVLEDYEIFHSKYKDL